MAYDTARQRAVLYSIGEGVWEWDGNTWVQRLTSTSPSRRGGSAMAYDAARQRVVLFGGGPAQVLGGMFSDTWLYGPLQPATSQTFGTGCGGPSGPPILSGSELYLGNPAARLELTAAPSSSVCLFGLATRTQALSIGPCTLYLAGTILPLAAVSSWAGFAESAALAVPVDVTLRGQTLYAQALVADSRTPVLGLAFSAGLQLVLGD